MTEEPERDDYDRLREEDPWYAEMAEIREELDQFAQKTINDQRVGMSVSVHLVRARVSLDQAMRERESTLFEALDDVKGNGC